MAYAGFDTYEYPGEKMMQWIKLHTNLTLVGFYLAPAPSHPDGSWMDARQTLADQGWGFAPVYVGQQEIGQPGSHNLTAQQGNLDGLEAGNLMSQAGFPPGSIVYLDCEQGGTASDATLEYVGAWVDSVTLSPNPYVAGVYCSHTTAPDLLAIRPDIYVWAWRITAPEPGLNFPTPDPGGSGVPHAKIWQYYQNEIVQFPGAPKPQLKIDLLSASVADPSQPSATARKKPTSKKPKARKTRRPAKRAAKTRKASKAKRPSTKRAPKKPKARTPKRPPAKRRGKASEKR